LGYALALTTGHGDTSHIHAGHSQGTALAGFTQLQGALALFTAIMAIYMAMSLLGHTPSPEIFLSVATRGWGRAMRRWSMGTGIRDSESSIPYPVRHTLSDLASLYILGLLWGLLPCGLVLAALLIAAATASPGPGALTMLAFGAGTLPIALSLSLAARWQKSRSLPIFWSRPLSAGVVLLFGLQMTLRGLAAWGWVAHFRLGELMLW
jgi:sulfite exporter TauE/SafE